MYMYVQGIIIFILIIALMFLFMYDVTSAKQFGVSNQENNPNIKCRDVLLHSQNRIRCMPEMRSKDTCKDINLYNEHDVIRHKGFINEMIYKPKQNISELQFENMLIENTMPLNEPICQINSTELPISNVNVNYLLKNQTDMLKPM